MNITYFLRGTKSVKKLYVRMYHNKLDLSVSTNLIFTDNQWDSENQSALNDTELNIGLSDLKSAILKQFNKDYILGVAITKKWLENTVKKSFMRPKAEVNLVNPSHTLFVYDFSCHWLENFASAWKVSSKKTMGKNLKGQYVKFTELLQDYEKVIGDKWQLRNLSMNDINGFVDWMEIEQYQNSTIERTIGRLRFFLNRASELGIEVSQAYKQRIYFSPDEETEGVILKEHEILKIVNKDLSFDQELHIAQQNFIMLLHTGMRGGDFLRNLDISNIKNNLIKIKTEKTKQTVVIPVHPVVNKIISDNFGNLPPKMHLHYFNKAIKTICMLCEIDDPMEGKVFDSKKKRKVKGTYKKWELVCSHTCRRGFATMYKNILPDDAICSIMGWKPGSKMLEHYNKKSKNDYAENLKEYWDNQ